MKKSGGLNFISKLFSGFAEKLSAERKPAAAANKPDAPDLKLLFFIVDWNRAAVVSNVFAEEKTGFHFISRGKGTASSEILDLLGIGASDKAVALCLEQTALVPALVNEVRKRLGFYHAGAGIAFTVPLSGINGPVLRLFKQPDSSKTAPYAVRADGGFERRRPGVDRRRADGNIYPNYLIISVVNKGGSKAFMDTARAAGAAGGTVLNARGRFQEEAVKVFGISVQEEREVVIILAGREKKDPIMQAIREAHGPDSEAPGLALTLPVDNVMSLSA